MTSWQKRTRIGLAIFGVAFSAIVYFSIGERRAQSPAAPVERFDQKAVGESTQVEVQRFRQSDQDFTIKSARSLTYEDGSAKMLDVEITVAKSDGRKYVVTTDEAQNGPNEGERILTGHVTLKVSDGFELSTDRATHNPGDGVVRAPGQVTFKRGGMTGSGANATYDQNKDLLTINEHAKIHISGDDGGTATDFSAGVATLDRLQNVLTLDGAAHVLRNEQVIDADHVTARLSDDEQIVQYVELRNNARVTGGGSIDSMSARDIDMDYSDDGRALERVAMVGGAGMAMKGTNGPGRQIVGDTLEVHLAPDGALVGVVGRNKVRLDLPASGESPAGSIRGEELDGVGEPGRGLTSVEFRQNVEYREAAKGSVAERLVRAQSLNATLADDAVTDATFKGRVTFTDEGVQARAADLRYQPRRDSLALSGSDAGGGPHVSLDQIAIDASAIDVFLDERRINAADVKTTLSPRKDPQAERAPGGSGIAIPGLLRQNEVVNINAGTLEYRGKAGQAIYRRGAALWQGATTIRADVINLDQETGSLVATGSARSTLELDAGLSTGRADEIRYDDAKRMVTYSTAPLAPTSERGSGSAAGARSGAPGDMRRAVPIREAQVGGPQGDLRAERIEIALAAQGNQVERLEGYTKVTLKLDMRTAVGTRLTYYASDGRYVMSGTGTTPVTITDAQSNASGAISCRETTGRTLTFFKSADTIIVDGNEQKRTQTQVKPCAAPSPR
jgi:lipopolysaccharide export system protein LptA